MRKVSAKNSRPFYKLFISIALVLLIPMSVIMGIFLYGLSDIVMEDYRSMNNKIIENISSTIDASLTSQINFSYSLSNISALNQLSAEITDDVANEQNICHELRNMLSSILFNNISSSVAIYFPHQDIVVSTQGSRSSSADFYERYIGYNDMLPDEFYSLVRATNHSQYIASAYSTPAILNRHRIMMYIQPISQGYLVPRAYFMATIDHDAFVRRIENSFEGDVQFQLFDHQGQELMRSDGVHDEWISAAGMHSSVRADNCSYHVFKPPVLSCGLRFVFYLPESIVMHQIDRFILICVLAISACLVLGLILANHLSRQLYEPFNQLLLTAFPEGHSYEISNMHEGFIRITDRMLETRLMNDRFRAELQTYFSTSRDTALMNLLTRSSYMDDDALSEAADICKLPMSCYYYQVAIFHARKTGANMPDMHMPSDDKTVLLIARLSQQQFAAIAAMSERDAENPLSAIASACHDGFEFGLSNIHSSIRELNLCLSEADSARLRSNDQHKVADDDAFYTLESELRIIASVRDGLYDDACRQLTDIRQRASGCSPQYITRLYAHMTATAKKAYEQLSGEAQNVLESEADRIIRIPMRELGQEQTFNEILAFYRQICNAATSDMHVKNQRIIENVREYLSENYTDSNICLDNVAEHLGVSYYFLSRIFKSETNQSFSDMLNDTRIYRAMELLRCTNMSVQDISIQVGYTNWSTFLRAFRKRAGMTPLQYRNAGK